MSNNVIANDGINSNDRSRKIPITGFWTFMCNPKLWAIDRALADNISRDTWEFNEWYQNDVQLGQYGVIRVGRDQRTREELAGNDRLESGIYAVVRIVSKPRIRDSSLDQYWNKELLNLDRSEKLIVDIEYVHNMINSPITLDYIKNDPILSRDRILVESFQRVSMPLQVEAFDRVLEIIERKNVFSSPHDELILYKHYSRKEAHDIFEPDTTFLPQRGSWGLQGIVPIKDRPGDYVFFVTYGQEAIDHTFDEGISEEGILRWQSQPKQALHHRQIQSFINHDELENSIYLFLRTSTTEKYYFLGKLQYLSHDSTRELPVYFLWQIFPWDRNKFDTLTKISFFEENVSLDVDENPTPKKGLEISEPPSISISNRRAGTTTSEFRAKYAIDYSRQEQNQMEIGLSGELLVLKHEIEYLTSNGKNDLAKKVKHISKVDGDGAGYDIKSYSLDGTQKFIEVKTTIGGKNSSFYISSNELAFLQKNTEGYYLYRVYNLNRNLSSGMLYIIPGDQFMEYYRLLPVNYRVSIL